MASEAKVRFDRSEVTGIFYGKLYGTKAESASADTMPELLIIMALKLSRRGYNDAWIIPTLLNAKDDYEKRVLEAGKKDLLRIMGW